MIELTKNGITKKAATGFSFKYLLFGAWYVWYKEGFGASCKHSLLTICTLGVYAIIQLFKYNNNYIKSLILDGYRPKDDKDRNYLIANIDYQL